MSIEELRISAERKDARMATLQELKRRLEELRNSTDSEACAALTEEKEAVLDGKVKGLEAAIAEVDKMLKGEG